MKVWVLMLYYWKPKEWKAQKYELRFYSDPEPAKIDAFRVMKQLRGNEKGTVITEDGSWTLAFSACDGEYQASVHPIPIYDHPIEKDS